MKPVQINISYATTDLPENVTAGVMLVTLTRADGSHAVDAAGTAIAPITGHDETEFNFVGVPSGSYIVTAQRLDGTGTPLGAAVVSAQTVIEQPSFNAPTAVVVKLG